MTPDEIVQIAVSAGIIPWTKHEHIGGNNFSASDEGLDGDFASLIQFAKLVAEHEHKEVERLKALCEEMLRELYVYRASENLKDVTAAIRARG